MSLPSDAVKIEDKSLPGGSWRPRDGREQPREAISLQSRRRTVRREFLRYEAALWRGVTRMINLEIFPIADSQN